MLIAIADPGVVNGLVVNRAYRLQLRALPGTRHMLKLIIVTTSIYLALVAVMFFKQRSLLYLPSKFGLTTEQADALSLKKWPDDIHYRGYLHDPTDAQRTIVIFHGNAGEAAHRSYYLDTLAATHARVILVEYPGYGQRTGSPSEELLVDDAITTLKLAADAFPYEPLVIIGESLGAGVASGAITGAARDIQGLVLITPWDSLTNLAGTHYRFLPVRWLLLDRYDSINNLQTFDGPKAHYRRGVGSYFPISAKLVKISLRASWFTVCCGSRKVKAVTHGRHTAHHP